MKPVLVLQHMATDGPGYLARWLRERDVPFQVLSSAAGQAFPASMRGYGALAVLGGEMSANDDLPSLRRAEQLIRESMESDLPVIGHCLGGQLMARALGARVHESAAPEASPTSTPYSSGTTRPSSCRPARWCLRAARPARTRRSRWDATSACSSTSKSTPRSCRAGPPARSLRSCNCNRLAPPCRAGRRCELWQHRRCTTSSASRTGCTRVGSASTAERAPFHDRNSTSRIVEGSDVAPPHSFSLWRMRHRIPEWRA